LHLGAEALVLQVEKAGRTLQIGQCLGRSNCYLSDGIDGLAVGISATACGVLAVFAVSSGQVVMAVLILSLLGALTGFLCFNFHPAKIFLGDSGSMFLGFMISASSVLCSMKSHAFVGLALPALALGVPIFDTLFSMLRRFLVRRSIFAADRSHFHHRLLGLGLKQRHAVILIYIVTFVATGLGMFMIVTESGATLVLFGCVLVLLLVLFRVVGSVHLHETLFGLQKRISMTGQMHEETRNFEHLQLQFEESRTLHEWWLAVCKAANQLDFAWLSLTATDKDGNTHTSIWRRSDSKSDLDDIIIMNVPVRSCESNVSVEFELAISRNGSLEAAGRRAMLFGRLIDECAVPETKPSGGRSQKKVACEPVTFRT